jgi:hypothetical protein
MKTTVKGKFEVKGTPQPTDEALQKLGAMRMVFDKRFEGPLEATSVAAMTGMMDMALGSGAYVALEKISGKLEGREGSFCLHHSSTMTRGKPEQSVRVVPDSGTGALTGIFGSMVIDIIEKQHFYTFEYEL